MGRLKPFWPIRCRPTEGARRLLERTAEDGRPAKGPFWKPFWPVRCRPTEGAGPLPERTAVVAGGPLVAPLIGELSAQLTERFSRQPLRPYGHLPYYGRHNPHGPSQAILAHQVPDDEGRKTVVRTDSCSWRPA